MKPCQALIVLMSCTASITSKYLGIPFGYSQIVSPSLLAPRTALDVLPISASTYPGSSTFFNQFPGLASSIPHYNFALKSPITVSSDVIAQKSQVTVEDVVDVTEEKKEAPATFVTVAHHIDAIPSPPHSPFRNELPIIPAGIGAQSTQPIFKHELFKNPKFGSSSVIVTNSKDSPILREIQIASAGLQPVVGLF